MEILCSPPEPTAGHRTGRRKTFFNRAVYLLPLEDLRGVRAALDRQSAQGEQEVKARALAAVQLLQEAADRRGPQSEEQEKTEKGVIPWRLPR